MHTAVAARGELRRNRFDMQLETTRFGTIDVDSESIITFTQPILGFQEFRRYILLPGPSDSLTWLQSTDSGELAFILVDPKRLIPDYKVELRSQELAEMAVTSADELDVYTLVVVPDDQRKVRTNLRAPVLINTKHRLGKQTILEGSQYPIQYYLAQAQPDPGGPRGRSPMLVLTRREDESIMIGDDIEVKVLNIKENQVKLGIVAPRVVAVHRREVYLAIQEENAQAASVAKVENLSNLIPR